MKKLKVFILNGLLLTAVSLAMRSVAVSFNVYLSNKIGAVAMGVFTLISSVYGFSITLATSGIHLATTRLVSEAIGNAEASGKDAGIPGIMRKCIAYALAFSVPTAALLFFAAPFIGPHWLGDERTIHSLQILAFSLPPIALSSSLSGYFTAVRHVHKNAAVQVLGEGVRICLCGFLLSAFIANDIESACNAVVLGGTIAEIVSFLFQFFLFLGEQKGFRNHTKQSEDTSKKLLHIALPVAFSAYVRSGLVTLEHLLIPRGLQKSGAGRETALATYGTLHSMVFPLVLFPSAISASFAGLLVPEIAEAKAASREDSILKIVDRVMNSVLIFAIGTAGIMMCFSHEIGNTVYPESDAGKYILLVAPLIPVMYLDTAVDSILKGIGEQVYCMGVNIVDSLLSVILVWILLPSLGIRGYVITVYFTEIVNATLSISRLLTVCPVKPRIFHWIARPLFCVIVSTTVSRYFLSQIGCFSYRTLDVFLHVSATVCLYAGMLLLFHAFRKKERKAKKEEKQKHTVKQAERQKKAAGTVSTLAG